MELQKIAHELKDPESKLAEPCNIKKLLLEIAEVLVAIANLIPNILIKNALIAFSGMIVVFADHVC